jgi:hypothetical protein
MSMRRPDRPLASRRPLGACLLLLAAALPAAWAGRAGAAETPPAPAVTIEKVTVSPPQPGPDTLCQLHVTLRNAGDKPASELAFTVKVNGRELPVYEQHLFMMRLDPGKSTDLRLFNFWSSESGRPAPADGKYVVEVSLDAARWYTIEQQGKEEVWTPVEPVAALPSRVAVTAGKGAAGG